MKNRRIPFRRAAAAASVFLAACSGAAVGPLHDRTADEYAVWSAAIQAEFGGVYGTMAVLDTTFSVETITPESEADLRAGAAGRSLPGELVEDFIARNRQSVHVNALRLDARGVRLIPELGGPFSPLVQRMAPAWLVVSRVGFDRGGNQAMVTVTFEDADRRCGSSTMLVHRGGDGVWRADRSIYRAAYGHVDQPAR